VALLALALASNARAAAVGVWSDERGEAEAARVIAECLQPFEGAIGYQNRQACVGKPVERCRTAVAANERLLAACVAYAFRAWDARLAGQVTRLRAMAGLHRPEFEESQSAFAVWSERDCAFQAVRAGRGSMGGYVLTSCKLAHAGQRALELELLADEWAAHPPD